MAVKEKLDSAEEFEWNVENEIQLFFAMNGHKPVGKKSQQFSTKRITSYVLTDFVTKVRKIVK